MAITLDHCVLNPYQPDLEQEIESVKEMLKQYRLSCVIETGARFLLDPYIVPTVYFCIQYVVRL